ncbi:unconventional myosin-X-like [Saccostrea cucullata]|uniref:unconventional myosin-X-like n=1 Tax=Saccostrea cuccullata TaxID=36930 RepID=UPI002ED410C0
MDCPDDLSQLADLSEDNITKVVKIRYKEDKIYTNVGEILLAVNPCKELTIYTENTKKQYDWGNFDAKLPPHVFDIATRAYRRMRQADGNQIILVCGESGAGKTESAKYMVEHLMHMVGHGTKDLNERIVKINTLLETFGNARTKMNHNSSRFAKFLQLSFGEDGRVIGAIVRDYMLEKCRVVARTPNCQEGNFHIFYALFAGLSEKEKRDLYLQKQETYEILQGSAENLRSEKKEEYRSRYESVRRILTQTGMKEDEQRIMKKMLAAILHLSEIKFDGVEGRVEIKYEETLEQAADLLGVQTTDLKKGLLQKSEKAGSKNTQTAAEVNRDALVKHTYDRLFGWVVKKINDNLHPNRKRNNGMKDIGILDIPGFEKLQDNKFEQLCINFVNEQLQVSMNRILIEEEQRIYHSEGINVGIGDISKGETCMVDVFEMKESAKELNRKLKEATPHFVRCIKPNEELQQDHFDAPFVGKQLRYNGIYELSKYRKNGFLVRIKFKDFVERYKIILPSDHTNEVGDDIAAMIDDLLKSQPELKLNGCFKVGKYMVFMKEELSNFIEKLLKEEEDRRKREKELMEERRKQKAKIEEEERLRKEKEKTKTEQNSDKDRETRDIV